MEVERDMETTERVHSVAIAHASVLSASCVQNFVDDLAAIYIKANQDKCLEKQLRAELSRLFQQSEIEFRDAQQQFATLLPPGATAAHRLVLAQRTCCTTTCCDAWRRLSSGTMSAAPYQ